MSKITSDAIWTGDCCHWLQCSITTVAFCYVDCHSFSYNYLLKGGNMYQLQQILGHKQIGLTVDLYGGLKARDLKEVSPYGF